MGYSNTTAQKQTTESGNTFSGPNAQRKMAAVPVLQKVEGEEELPIQGVFVAQRQAPEQDSPTQTKPNTTGMPDNLKSGVENLSGFSMDDVKVHYNSSKPAQLQALAYAQGSDIHVAPGQEKHLPHEAWHVVQQKQGRVQPTMQMKEGVAVNDDKGLESEADVMGGKAMQMIINRNAIEVSKIHLQKSDQSTFQLKPMNYAITGITHLVAIKGKSIFQGSEFMEVEDGDIIRIETDEHYLSRRGPNQEEFREDDQIGEHIYDWYRVIAVNGLPLLGKVFVRDDTYRKLTIEEQHISKPDAITGAMGKGVAKANDVDIAIKQYLKTGKDVQKAILILNSLTKAKEMKQVAPKATAQDAKEGAEKLEENFFKLTDFENILLPLGDGANESSRYFLNQLETLFGHLKKGMKPKTFVEMLINTTIIKALEYHENNTEMGTQDTSKFKGAELPGVGENMDTLINRYDVISRKCSSSTRRSGAIHEVDIAMMPRTHGIANIKASIEESGKVIIEPGQDERAFAIGYSGAIAFSGDLSNQGGERLYAVLFPKGWLSLFSQDVRYDNKKSAREPGLDEFREKKFIDKENTIVIEGGKAFLTRAEESTGKEGQITVHMDRNELLFGGKPMLEFIRAASLGTVEFDMKGNILYICMY